MSWAVDTEHSGEYAPTIWDSSSPPVVSVYEQYPMNNEGVLEQLRHKNHFTVVMDLVEPVAAGEGSEFFLVKVTPVFPEDSCGVVGFFGNWFGVLVNPNRDFGNRFWFGVLVLVLVLVDLF